MFSMVMACL
jgi:hypothetical protein